MEKIAVAEVIKLSDGMPIDKTVSGIIKFVGNVRTLTHGTTQSISIEDPTGSIWVEIDGHDELNYKEVKGKMITFYPWQDDDKKWRGLSKTSYEKKDEESGQVKTVAKMKCTKTGKYKITEVDVKPPQQEGQPSSQQNNTTVSQSSAGSKTGEQPPVKSGVDVKAEERQYWINKDKLDRRNMIVIAIVKEVLGQHTAGGRITLSDIPKLADACFFFVEGDQKYETLLKELDVVPFAPEQE